MLRVLRTSWSNLDEGLRQVSERVNDIGRGRTNASGEVTLTNSQTTTVVNDVNVSADSEVLLMAKTADAAAEQAYVSNTANGSFTITHANAVTTRTFGYLIAG